MHLLKLSLRPWRLSFWSQAFSVSAVAFLLLGTALLLWMERGLGPLVERLRGEQVITAYLDAELDEEGARSVVDSIATSLGARAELVDGAGFVAELKASRYEELARQLEDLGPEMDTVVPRFVTVKGQFGDDALGRVQSAEGVEAAESSRDRYRQVAGAFSALRWTARAIAAGLLLALLTGLIHLARANAQIHREAVALLRLWGAGPIALRFPALFSGLLVGALGGGLAAGAWHALGREVAGRLGELSPALAGLPAPSPTHAAALAAAGLALGLLAGAAGVPAAGAAGRG